MSARSSRECMRFVIALIQPTKLKAVQEALTKVGVARMTVCDASGYGQQQGKQPGAEANHSRIPLLRKVALEIAVNEDYLEKAITAIEYAARTGASGSRGDGKIFVLPVEEVVRLSDSISGPEAVS